MACRTGCPTQDYHSHSNTNATSQPGAGGESSHNHGINGTSTNSHTSNITGNTGNLGGQDSSHAHGINTMSTTGAGNAAHNWNTMSTGNITARNKDVHIILND